MFSKQLMIFLYTRFYTWVLNILFWMILPQDRANNAYFPEDEELKGWIRDLSENGTITVETAKVRLNKLCELLSLSPKELLQLAKNDLKKFKDSLIKAISKLEDEEKSDEEKSPEYIVEMFKAVRIWLGCSDIKLNTRAFFEIYEDEIGRLRIVLKKLKEEKLESENKVVTEKELEEYVINDLGVNYLE
jgi:hypothetical protein